MAAFDQGEISGIFGLATDILAREDQLKTKMTALVFGNGQYKLRYLLLVRKADGVSSIEQLKGKRISIPQFQEIESIYLNTLLLRHKQMESAQFFSEIVNTSNSNTTIADLFFGRVDAAIVNENEYQTAMELNPQIAIKIIVLEQSAPFVLLAGANRSSLSADMEARVLSAGIDFPKTEVGRNFYKLMNVIALRIIDTHDLDSLRALKSEYEQLKNAGTLKVEQKAIRPSTQKPRQKRLTAADKKEAK